MKGFIAIAGREFRERRLLLVAAAIASLVPLAFPILRGLTGEDAAWARSSAALILSAAFAFGIALGLGASMLAPAMADRRIAFDFARPVSAFAIWTGRLAAAATLAVLTAVIVWIPSKIAGAQIPVRDLFVAADLTGWPIGFLFAILALFGVAHFTGVAWRSRSVWMIADLAILAAGVVAIPRILGRPGSWRFALLTTIALLGVGFLVAGWASVAHGRTDVGAAHRAATLSLAAALGVTLVTVGGHSTWVLAAGPSSLAEARFTAAAPTGSWTVVKGKARGAQASFVYDTKNGRYVRTAASGWRWPELSADGGHAFWLEGRPGALVGRTLALDAPGSAPQTTRLHLDGEPDFSVLSEDGSRLAVGNEGALSVYDVASGRLLASVNLGKARAYRGFFAGKDRLRVFTATDERGPWQLGIQELDLAAKKLQTTGTIANVTGYFALSPDGARIAANQKGEGLRMFDGATGAALARLTDEARTQLGWFGFLWDGTAVVIDKSLESRRLLVFAKDGSLDRSIPLPPGDRVSFGGEVAPGRLVVAAGADWIRPIFIVDVRTGETRRVAEALFPVAAFTTWFGPPSAARPGSDATKLFHAPHDALVHLDPETGEQRLILGARAP